MAMRPNQPVGGGPESTIDNLYGKGVYGSIQNMLASGNPQLTRQANLLLQSGMGTQSAIDASRQSARPTSGTNAAGAWQLTDSSNVVTPQAPQPQGQDIYGANFGTFTGDAMGKLRAMGMMPNEQAAPQDTRDYAGLNASAMRSQLEALNNGPRAVNPYGMNNSGYLASQAQVVGQEGQSLLNALRSQQASNALRGIKQSDGLAQNQQNQLRMQTALGRNAALTGLETARYDKASEWDKWDTNNRMQLAQAVDSGNINRFNAIMGQRNTEYEQDRNRPFDQLKLASGVQDFEQQGRMNPLEVLYRQGQVTGQGIDNEGGRLRNVQYGYGNDITRQTMGDQINATNAQNRLSYLGNTQQYGVMNDLGNDAGFRNDIRDGYKWNAARGKTQAMGGFFNDLQQPMRQAEQDVYGRVGNFLDLGLKGGKLFSGAGFGG
jgi:hypothetical protein